MLSIGTHSWMRPQNGLWEPSNTGGGGTKSISLNPPCYSSTAITELDLIFFIQVFKTRRQRVKTLDSVSCGTICTVGGAMEARFNKNTEFLNITILNNQITKQRNY